jgi:hypothetical protein
LDLYQVTVRGNNCLVELDGKVQRLGFFAIGYAEARNVETAESEVLERVRSLLATKPLLNPVSEVRLSVDSVQSVATSRPEKGNFLWFPEDEPLQ